MYKGVYKILRAKFSFDSTNPVEIPIQYNNILQALIYKNLDDSDFSSFLHDRGYKWGKRSFKLFTFSRIFGGFEINAKKGCIIFYTPISIIVSSAVDKLIEYLANTMIKKRNLYLKDQKILIRGFEIEQEKSFSNRVNIEMLSPMTAYTTFKSPTGKKTYYYSPDERDFEKILKDNLIKKQSLIDPDQKISESFSIKPIGKHSKRNRKILKFKDFVIEGWMGRYQLSGDSNLIKTAYYTGLGAKNSMGFGCWKIIEEGGADIKSNN